MEMLIETLEALNTQVFHIATDWWIFWATLGAGIFSAIATVIAVVYTHRQTSKLYKETMEVNEQRHKEELARSK